jgi:peptidoglycan/LPS O-acetylase OafA/YrhL
MVIKNVQALRALAANGVLLAHLFVVEQKYGHGVAFLPDSSRLGPCGVSLFFVISGFIMATIARDVSWRRFLFDRMTRIFPPYWFYTTLVLAVSVVFPAFVNSSFQHAPSLLRSYLLIPDEVGPLLAVGWTLIHEMYFYLGFALILGLMHAFKFRLPVCLLAWAALIVLLNLLGHDLTQNSAPVLAVIAHPLTFDFMLGALIGFALQKGLRVFALPALLAGIAGLIFFLAFPGVGAITEAANWPSVLFIGASCALIVYGAAALELNGAAAAPHGLVALGNASYSTYLSHVLVISAAGRLYAAVPDHSNLTEIAFVILCVVLANGAGLLSCRLIEGRTTRYARNRLKAFFVEKDCRSPAFGKFEKSE